MQSNQLLLKPLASSSYSELLGWLEVQIYIKQKQHKSWHQRFNAVNQMDLWTGCHPKIAWPCFQRCRIYKNMCRSLGGEPNLLQNFNQNLCHYQLKISQKTERGFESFLLLTIIIFNMYSHSVPSCRMGEIYLYIFVYSVKQTCFQRFNVCFSTLFFTKKTRSKNIRVDHLLNLGSMRGWW